MKISRRDLSVLLPALATAKLASGGTALPSKTYSYGDLPVKSNGANRSRAILNGDTHSGVNIELHETELGPGMAPHPPHHHVHEEMILIREGTMAVTISGKTTELGPGAVAYVASNEEHGWKNVGNDRAKYFVLAIGREKA